MGAMLDRLSRRELLLATPALPALAQTTSSRPAAAAKPDLVPLNRLPRMVQEYFTVQVRRAGQASVRALDALKTKADAEAHVKTLRARIRQSFGPMPERTPLNARVAGTVDRDHYRIEKVVFESRPGFLVTANLYLPKGRRAPSPAVVGACGHSTNGKAGDTYQSFAQGLARQGYVCLLYDPIGQGERPQYVGPGMPKVGPGVSEHLYAGNQQFLVGEFLGSWRAWDGIRALDYLLARPEVDKRHLGITGNSGGGTMTTWLCGLESRWTMAAPGCFVTTFRRNLENELPADTEQCPPRALALGLDHADFIAALAPKPVILLGKEKDYFDARGLEEAYARLKRLYTLLGAPQNIALHIGPTYHGYTQENREAMYRWFNRVTGVSDAKSEPALVMEKDETLWCFPDGKVATAGSKATFVFTQAKSRELAAKRKPLTGDALAQAVTRTLRIPPRQGVPEYRILRPLSGRNYPKRNCASYLVETEPGVYASVYRLNDEPLLSRPPKGIARAVLYVSHLSADEELRKEPLVKELIAAESGAAFYACDVRGIGDSRPDTCGPNSFLAPYGSDFFYAIHSIMLDRPYLGQRTRDVLAVLDWLKAQGHAEVHLAGLRWGALPAAFAALLSPLAAKVTLKNALASYSAVAESTEYRWPLALLVPGVLERFDLPDCYRALEAKGLRQIDPAGALG
jgi:dienelactone hydrolase/pimeloyl-ACP methyl ester carboxylesterase